jgi:hypothetical protein
MGMSFNRIIVKMIYNLIEEKIENDARFYANRYLSVRLPQGILKKILENHYLYACNKLNADSIFDFRFGIELNGLH